MRLLGVLFLCCLAVQSAFAAETNLTLTVDGVTYSNVTFGTVTPSSVTISYRTGVARIPLGKLPPELQKQFGYDPQKDAEWKKAEQQRAVWEQQRVILAQWSKRPLTKPLKVGMMGISCNGKLKVIQVVGPDEMFVEISVEDEGRSAYEQWTGPGDWRVGGAGHWKAKQGQLEKFCRSNEVWIKGISTAEVIDGVELNCKEAVFKVTGTKTYTTAAGAIRTIFMLELVTSVNPP